MSKNVVVIGGGASGLMAAIVAARNDAMVTIIEHKDRVGKKILMTGNGKCNLTNMNDFHGKYYSDNIELVYKLLDKYNAEDARRFFQNIGLYTKEKRDGGVYPVSEQASSVLDVLRSECSRLKIKVLTDCNAESISVKEKCVKTSTGQVNYDSLIIAAGGQAASVAGSDGSGYKLAKSIGHNLIKPLPALVQLRCDGKFFKAVAGVRAQALIRVYIDNEEIVTEEGELQLTDYGISGIPVFQISRVINKALDKNKKCDVYIDFMTYMSQNDMDNILNNLDNHKHKTVEEWLGGMVHKKVASLVCKENNISASTTVKEVSNKQLIACIKKLRNFKVTVKASNPFENAQVCCGGVPLNEIDENMQSIKSKNIYLIGELLDCDGICGGYNLQWAWATGTIAGRHAALS